MIHGKTLENATTESTTLFTQHSLLIKDPSSMVQLSSNGLVFQLVDYDPSLRTNWFQGHGVILGTQIKEASKLILPRDLHLKSTQGRPKLPRDLCLCLRPSTQQVIQKNRTNEQKIREVALIKESTVIVHLRKFTLDEELNQKSQINKNRCLKDNTLTLRHITYRRILSLHSEPICAFQFLYKRVKQFSIKINSDTIPHLL